MSSLLGFVFAISFTAFSAPTSAIGAAPSCQVVFREFQPLRVNRLNAKTTAQVQNYLADTINSLELMRGENGLVKDTIWIRSEANGKPMIRTLNANTSPTNIAVDLLIQTERVSRHHDIVLGNRNISNILSTLGRLKRHKASGLFFGWYATDQISAVASSNLSSIDNVHLAIALWTIKETFPGTKFAQQAKTLLAPMDLSMFYDESSGLIGGNFRFVEGKWLRDEYNFANLGSEARTLYSAGWALGLFKKYQQKSDFVEKAFSSLKSEVLRSRQGPLLKLWDGSAFQIFFPKIFISEESYSPTINKMYRANGNFMISEGRRRQLPVPAAHSAGVALMIDENAQTIVPYYHDKAGIKLLVSSGNKDVFDPALEATWDGTFTPYALFMAATANPAKFLPLLAKIQNIRSGSNLIYISGLGWMDGLQLTGDTAGQVVPAQLAVNQGMIALSLLQMQSPDGLSASGRAIKENPIVSARLTAFFDLFDKQIAKKDAK
jgi:hypothetical protein